MVVCDHIVFVLIIFWVELQFYFFYEGMHESMFVSLYHDVATARGVSSVAQRANFSKSLVFKVQFLVLDAHIASP